MTMSLLRTNFFIHDWQEYEVQAVLLDDRNIRPEATVSIRVRDRDRNTIALHYDGPAAPPRTAHYEVPISQNAKLQAVLQDAALQDAVSEVMQLAEDDVKRLLV
jgi:hypothetical protein